ncbi:unnamed protein product [Phaedon cochleariae]|uniref:Cytochrome P450 n=1 Tax=Phaedon cochleariae TaxID=80249 RepID=A0A9N9X724_PHACE|nr:unnamed protein product [Phaedon cochleariae]
MLFVVIVILIALLYYSSKRNLNYWERMGIPGPKPYPIIGNMGDIFIGKRGAEEIYADIYRKYEGYPFVGVYKAGIPVLLVRDPDLIKNIVQKDFNIFHENDIFVDKQIDPIFGRNPFAVKGAEWKNIRSQMTSCFTSGKMKGLFPVLEKNVERMMSYLDNQMKTSTCFEAKEIFVRLMLDNVAACALGIQGKCFDEPYSEVRKMADHFFFSKGITSLKFIIIFNLPPLSKFLRLKVVSRDVEDKLLDIVKTTLQYRKENNIVINDILDSIAQISATQNVTELDITSHIATFFTNAFETSSLTMSFLIYELAQNPKIQEKLRQEINESYEKNNKSFSYESIQDMEYLDACFRENLRKHATVPLMPKICTETYKYVPTNPDFKPIELTLEPGTSIIIPSTAIHHDPKYYENPDDFVPERFLGKENINKFTYLAFGGGPRMCIGTRFALSQIKIGVAHLIKNYEFTVNPKAKIPVKYDPFYFLLTASGGLWVDVRKINQ